MKLPDGITLVNENGTLTANGPKGTASYSYDARKVKVSIADGEVTVSLVGKKSTRALHALENAVQAHIRNLSAGVQGGHSKKLSVVFSHFPVSIEVKGREVYIKNFMGEKEARKAKIIGNETVVQTTKTDLNISGTNREHVGQTAANIVNATRLTKRDRRIFQDGIYPALNQS